MVEFVMPKLGADMTAGTLVAWHKKPGERVERGDVIAEVDTEKGDIDVEVFASGVIEQLLIEPGATVPVGTPMALIREEGVGPSLPTVPAGPTVTRLVISPSARKLARELGVEPASVRGTGPGGAITRDDIQRAAAGRPTPLATQPTPATTPAKDRSARMRQAIAAAMSRSKREIPHYYLSTTIDMHAALAWLNQANLNRSVEQRLLYAMLLIKAVAVALRDYPDLNGFWREGSFEKSDAIHVGVAISLRQGGLVAPALHHADKQGLDELMRNFRDLVQRSRTGELRGSELSDPTITVTSLGERGVESVFGIINPPQVAIVGFGKLVERPWIVEGQVVPRPVITATLSADHRVTDGHRGGLFLATVQHLLQEPSKL
jgi:pyruvate dehydrogenase E2 component (dihydrolipoamide acetyltransferase)